MTSRLAAKSKAEKISEAFPAGAAFSVQPLPSEKAPKTPFDSFMKAQGGSPCISMRRRGGRPSGGTAWNQGVGGAVVGRGVEAEEMLIRTQPLVK